MADDINATEMRKSGGSRLNEILKRSRGDNELSSDTPDIYFDYEDTDTYQGEMSELYSYTEEEEFNQNKECFQQLFYLRYPDGTLWWSLKDHERRDEVLRLANLLEVANKDLRLQAIRALLYLMQGTFAECSNKPPLHRASTRKEDKKSLLNNDENTNNVNNNSKSETIEKQETTNKIYSKNLSKTPKKALFILDEHTMYVARNTVLLYHCGIFQTCTQLLNMEISCSTSSSGTSVNLSDNKELRYLLSILYSMLEAIRFQLTPKVAELKEDLKADLVMCLPNYNDSLIMTLFGMVTQFCEAHPCHFPIKKVLLLLWKSLLLILGGLDDAFALKNETRQKQGLPLLSEDPHEVCRNMRSSSPPASAADLIEQHQQQHRGGRAALRKLATRQGSMEDDAMMSSVDEDGIDGVKSMMSDDEDNAPPIPPRPASPLPPKALPWLPKVRMKDLEAFLYQTRSKFIGFHVDKDVQSLFGLPHPIHEGVEVFKQRLYVSLSEVQTQKEEDFARNPLSMSEGTVEQTASEVLYQAIYQTLPSYNIALLKVLLAAAPTSKAKSDNINILADLLPEKMPTSVLHSMKLGIDVNRHKEIIVKALSAILILLLKHFKINHFYQFEFMAQHLVFANCIPLVLKFMNQNILAHICAKNNISMIDFPLCVIGETPELNAENLEVGDNEEYCWRNLFSSINLLRVLNKITKWKHSRIVLLVAFKSAPILKRALKVRQPMHQMYVLKLLKMQTKYLGRQWRKSNMKCMSAIYQKVRHRLNDDWAYGNDVDARPWDFQSEESVAKTAIDQFNQRRYQNPKDNRDSSINNNSANATSVAGSVSILNDFTPVDNCLQSVLSSKVELSREFEENYEEWLECEVFAQKIDWNQFLLAPAVKN